MEELRRARKGKQVDRSPQQGGTHQEEDEQIDLAFLDGFFESETHSTSNMVGREEDLNSGESSRNGPSATSITEIVDSPHPETSQPTHPLHNSRSQDNDASSIKRRNDSQDHTGLRREKNKNPNDNQRACASIQARAL